MGAGIQRWWRDPDRYRSACDDWRQQQRRQNAQLVVDIPPGKVHKVRPLITAFAILWKEVS